MSEETLKLKITEQGDKVRQLKSEKAGKEAITAAVKILLDLKLEYKSTTGNDFPVAKQEPKKDKPKQEQNTPNLKKQEEKARKKAEKAAKKAAHKEANKTTENNQNATVSSNKIDTSIDVSQGLYGIMPMIKSAQYTDRKLTKIRSLSKADCGKELWVRGRVHSTRLQSSKLCFLILREQQFTLQCICAANNKTVDSKMVKYLGEEVNNECIIDLRIKVRASIETIKSCYHKDIECDILEYWVVSKAAPVLPFQIDDAQRSEADFAKDEKYVRVGLDTRLNNRILDIRTTTNQAIFKVQANITGAFRKILTDDGFIELQFPKILGSVSEGAGANVFSLSYFKKTGYLAQSPQLYKQMAIAGDFDRVFTVGPVFRAEDSNTHRHLCEFVGLDLEMAFSYHYHEVVNKIGETFTKIFKHLRDNCQTEIATINKQHPASEFEFCEPPLILNFAEGVKMLNDAGVDQGMTDDLSTPNEKFLGKLVKAKYHTDYYILDKFPLAVRPFYTMPDPNDSKWSNSYDMFMRGEEILSGAQRVHDPEYLAERIIEFGARPEDFTDYIDSFRYGCPPHAGGGIGLERVTMLYLGLGNIRQCSLFPRDPKRLTP